jgi:hypothetical protein
MSTPTSRADGRNEIDADLQRILDAWPTLPEALGAGILAMIQKPGKMDENGVRSNDRLPNAPFGFDFDSSSCDNSAARATLGDGCATDWLRMGIPRNSPRLVPRTG